MALGVVIMARPRHIPAPGDVGEVFSCAGLFIKAKTAHEPPSSLGQIENSYKNARRSLSARSEVDYEQELSCLDRFVRNDDLEGIDALAANLGIATHPLISKALQEDRLISLLEEDLKAKRAKRNHFVQLAVEAGVSPASVARSFNKKQGAVSHWLKG